MLLFSSPWLNYLISLCTVYLRSTGLNFFNSIRSGVFFRFFVVIYREVPGMPESLCSVHSRITCCRLPFLAIFRELGCKYNESSRDNKVFIQIQHSPVNKPLKACENPFITRLALTFHHGICSDHFIQAEICSAQSDARQKINSKEPREFEHTQEIQPIWKMERTMVFGSRDSRK